MSQKTTLVSVLEGEGEAGVLGDREKAGSYTKGQELCRYSRVPESRRLPQATRCRGMKTKESTAGDNPEKQGLSSG